MKKLAFAILVTTSFNWALGQSKTKLLAKESVYIYNNSLDTIELTEPGNVHYLYCEPYDSAGYKLYRRKVYNMRVPTLLRHTAVVDSVPDGFLSAYSLNPLEMYNISECYGIAIIDSVQIDGKGSKEMVFHRGIRGDVGYPQASDYGECSVWLEKIEVWNIDSQELLWEQVTKFNFHHSQGQIGLLFHEWNSFEFEFSIADDGLITLVDQFGLKERHSLGLPPPPRMLTFNTKGELIPPPEDNKTTEDAICPDLKERRFGFVGNSYVEM